MQNPIPLQDRLNPDKLKQILFIIALIGLGGFLLWLLKAFVSAFLGATIFYIVFRKPLFKLTEKRKWPKPLAILLLMFTSFVILILPVALVSIMLSGKISYLIAHFDEILQLLQAQSDKLSAWIGIDLLNKDTTMKVAGYAANIVPGFLTATLGAVVDIVVLYFLLYFMMANARLMEGFVRKHLPFSDSNDALLLTELKNQTLSNAIGIPILAVLQGICAWLGYIVLGVDEPFFWAVITALMSVIPLVGTTIVWVPLSVMLFVKGQTWQGAVLLLYGTIIITNIDNVFRFVVQKKLGDIHPLITFFGVIIGIGLFGFVGIIFGPLLISYFILLVRIYDNEYNRKVEILQK
jgi:predicted PurR-regulated permease PerM